MPAVKWTRFNETYRYWEYSTDGSTFAPLNENPRWRVYNSADINILNNTETAVTFNSERFDTDAFHSTGSNTSRITIPTGFAGVYCFGGSVRFDASAVGDRLVYVKINNSQVLVNQQVTASTLVHSISCATIYALADADYIELFVFQSSGGTLALKQVNNFSPEFWGFRVSA
jgi:hypothetical protein